MRGMNEQLELDNDQPIPTLFLETYLCLECKLDYPLNEMATKSEHEDSGCCYECHNIENGYFPEEGQ